MGIFLSRIDPDDEQEYSDDIYLTAISFRYTRNCNPIL